MGTSVSKPHIQYGALPWRQSGNSLQILLITTLNTRRWIVPKGWPLEGKSACDCAAQEAMEEAGITGEIEKTPLGSFQYNKVRKNGDVLSCRVDVFPMRVARERRDWADKHARETRWCSLEEALERVSEPGLRRLISKFAKRKPRTQHAARHAA